MKKMRKALLALLLSITVAGTSAVPVMAAGTNTSVPTQRFRHRRLTAQRQTNYLPR